MTISVEYCGEWFTPESGAQLNIGRDGDVQIDDNPYLHRHFLRLVHQSEMWWLVNVGTQLSATVSEAGGTFQGWLAPGARLPMVFAETMVIFTAGPTTYELRVLNDDAAFVPAHGTAVGGGETTIGPVVLTLSQKQLIVALAEPLLRRDGSSSSAIPSSREAADRLGWEITRFNRKLDNVCDKFDRRGVRGLRGGPGRLAVNRRARLVEHAISSRLVTPDDLPLLELDAP